MMIIIKTILFLLLLGLFLYSKLLPHATNLNSNASKYFSFLDKLFKPICSFFSRNLPTRWEIGNNGLKLDLGQLIFFAILLLIYRSL
jgi:hypothetical protein